MDTSTTNLECKTLTVIQLATVLGISKNFAYQLVKSKDFFPAIQYGKKIIISKPALDIWLERR